MVSNSGYCYFLVIGISAIALTHIFLYLSRVNHLEEERQGMAMALSDAQRKLEEEKYRTQQLSQQVRTRLGSIPEEQCFITSLLSEEVK